MDLLDARDIAARLAPAAASVRVLARCGSTNAELLAQAFAAGSSDARPVVLATEEQTAGRGRHGRRWHSAPGAGATFSILRRMRCAPRALAGLSLAAGVAAARALRALGAAEASLKWPNDLIARGAKLGGLLVETRQQGRETAAVVGIGINCRASPPLAARLRRRVAALDQFVRPPLARNAVIGAVAREVLAALEAFERSGLPAFAAEWTAMHAHEGQRIRVRLADGSTVSGIAAGLARNGALRLQTRAGWREVASGHVVSARAA
ncbi:MAG: biotin--[acetyl-CoA-carboxylase] ligase [Burkholderiales bacterium]